MGTNKYAKQRMALIAGILACVVLAMLASCKGNSQPNSTGQVAGSGAQAQTQTPGAMTPGGRPPTAGGPGAAGKTKGATANPKPGAPPGAPGETPAKDAPVGPKVEVTDLLVDGPGVDFTGPGRYDVTISALLTEPWKAGVWDVVAYGEDGKEVGKQEIFLTLSESKPKTLMFNDFYCDSIPVKIALVWTDKKGDTSKSEPGKESGKPNAPGGGGSKAPGGGQANTPGGGQNTGGGGAKPPPGDGGDKGGNGEGGSGEGSGE